MKRCGLVVVLLFLSGVSVARAESAACGDWPRAFAPAAGYPAFCLAISAEEADDSGESEAPMPPDEPPRRHLEQFRLLKLLELLDLEEKQELEFMIAYRDFRRQERVLERERRRLLEDLGRALRRSPEQEKRIDDGIEVLRKHRVEQAQQGDRFMISHRRMLKPAQLGRLVLFEERFEYEILERIRGLRQRPDQPGRPDSARRGSR